MVSEFVTVADDRCARPIMVVRIVHRACTWEGNNHFSFARALHANYLCKDDLWNCFWTESEQNRQSKANNWRPTLVSTAQGSLCFFEELAMGVNWLPSWSTTRGVKCT